MVTLLQEPDVRAWLLNNGIGDLKAINDVINGIDFSKPVYLEWLEEGTKLVQYRDNPSLNYPDAGASQWFTLGNHSGSIRSLGIGHGPAGRTKYVLTVRRGVQVLASTAKSMDSATRNEYDRYIGPGGATQIFIPDRGLSSLG
jgi:hypothetical protein